MLNELKIHKNLKVQRAGMRNTITSLNFTQELKNSPPMSNRTTGQFRSNIIKASIMLILSFLSVASLHSQCQLACNNEVQVSLDNTCIGVVTPDMVLEGYDPIACAGLFAVTVEDQYGNIMGDMVGSGQVGQTLKVTVTEIATQNSCWGNIIVEDKSGPILLCEDVTILCSEDTSVEGIGFPVPMDATVTGDNPYDVLGLDPCGPATLVLSEQVITMDCSSPLTEMIIRTWNAQDQFGNQSIPCSDTIRVVRTDLSSIVLPNDYDNLDLPVLSCDEDFPVDEEGYPSTARTGMPTGAFCENIQQSYENIEIPICENSYKLLRNWTILDWCTGEVIEHGQVIKVLDTLAPEIICPPNTTISTNVHSCFATYLLEPPSLTDNCTAMPTYSVSSVSGIITELNGFFTISNLPLGYHEITYTGSDDCNNLSDCVLELWVEDQIAPIPVCDEHTVVAIGSDGIAKVFAETFDDGSHDNCQLRDMEARRIGDNCGIDSLYNFFKEKVYFCCDDIKFDDAGNRIPIMVEYRVTDQAGNSNTCMVEVEVLDDLDPYLIPPPDITLECTADYESTFITGELLDENVIDNCPGWTVETSITSEDFDKCGRGTAIRTWTVTDASGNSASRTQEITLIDFDPFDEDDITWPDDVTLSMCGANTDEEILGSPIIMDDVCSLVAISSTDDEFTIVQDGCAKILRRWTVIDVCTYDEDWYDLHDGLNGYGPGYYTHTQIIKVINNNAPIISNTCQDTIVDFYESCGGPFNYTVNATDDCTEDLEYRLSVDYDNDGIFEIFDEYYANGVFSDAFVEEGTHRMRWLIEDRCGNFSECDFLFTMRDAKAPTPYCLSSVATAVMNTDGTIGIWATDYDLGSIDNCTPQEDLIFSFTEDGLMPSYEFSCLDIPDGISATIPLQVWVIDSVGNRDFCMVQIELQDNNSNACEESETILVSGRLNTANNEGITGAMVAAYSNIFNLPKEIMTDGAGKYSFDQLPMGADYLITASKNDDVTNGVSTLDLVLIQKHILGLSYLDSPYKVIAADINNSSTISAADLIAMRKVILGIDDVFPNEQQSWRFVDKNQQFLDPNVPFPFKESVTLDNLDNNSTNLDFMGIKIGDVNGSVHMSPEMLNSTDRSNESIVLFADDEVISEQNESIEVRALNFDEIVGLQFTIAYDKALSEVEGITSEILEIDQSNYHIDRKKGLIAFSWNDFTPLSLDEGDIIFEIHLEHHENVRVSNFIHFNDAMVRPEAYDTDTETKTVELRFNANEDGEEFVLMQNSPNPFTEETNISFILPEAGRATISIFDVAGKMIKNIDASFDKGMNTITISKADLNTSGILYYRLEAGANTATGKMIGLE